MIEYGPFTVSVTFMRIAVPTVAFAFYVYYVWLKDML